MRVSSNSNPYGGNQPSTTDRAVMFKRKFKAGQLLKGRMLRVEQEGFAWVLIGDMELLAQVETMPEQGQWLEFLVLALEPSILLRQLQHGADPRGSVFLRDYIRSYLTERDKLDAQLAHSLWDVLKPDSPPEDAHATLINFLTRSPEALDQFTRVMRLQLSVQRMISTSNNGTFHYMPWLMPSARGVEILVSPPENNICTVTAGVILQGAQHVLTVGQMNLSSDPVSFAYRLLLDKNCKAGNNTSRANTASTNCTCLGTAELPAGAHDILSMLFKEIPAQRRGLNLRA